MSDYITTRWCGSTRGHYPHVWSDGSSGIRYVRTQCPGHVPTPKCDREHVRPAPEKPQ